MNSPLPTIWGLTPLDIHNRYWDAHGVSVVRCGGAPPSEEDAELFVLMGEHSMALFDAVAAAEHLHWANCHLLPVRIRQAAGSAWQSGGPSLSRCDSAGFQGAPRVVVTAVPTIAAAWASGGSTWRRVRGEVPQCRRGALSLKGFYCDATVPEDAERLIARIAARWDRPDQSIERAQRIAPRVWIDAVSGAGKPLCPRRSVAWLGAGHANVPDIAANEPVVLWDKFSVTTESMIGTSPPDADPVCGVIAT